MFVRDEPGDRLYVLAEGVVKLFVGSRNSDIVELVRHRAPATFGEVALLDGGPRTASAEAVERSTLLVMTRAELLHLLKAEDQVAEALLTTLGAMVRRTTRQVSDLVFLDLQGGSPGSCWRWPPTATGRPALVRSPRPSWPPWSAGPGRRCGSTAVPRVPRPHPGRRPQFRDSRPGTVGASGRAVEILVVVS